MISSEDIKKLGALARITISPDEAKALALDAEAILGYVSQVGEAPVGGEGDAHTHLRNVMREDGEPHEAGLYTIEILENAPRTKDGYITVRKVITRE